LVAEVGDAARFRVVAPRLAEDWLSSPWAAVLPTLDPNHRLSATADAFLDEVARAYVLDAIAAMRAVALRAGAALTASFERLQAEVSKVDALSFLRWSRDSASRWPRNEGVVHSAELQRAVLALALVMDPDEPISILRLPQYAYVRSGSKTFGLILAKNRTATEIMSEARRRSEDATRNGLDLGNDLTYICVGNIDDVSRPAVLQNLIGPLAGADLIDGTRTREPQLLAAQTVLEGRAA
jgi:hypothetical protein